VLYCCLQRLIVAAASSSGSRSNCAASVIINYYCQARPKSDNDDGAWMVKNCRERGEYNYSCAEKRGKSESAMFPAAGKGERRSLRGSARLSSKMSGKLPRLRVLRPRQQHQRRARTTESVAIVDAATSATPRPEGNLKGAVASHEVEHDGKRNDAKKGEDTFASVAVTADTVIRKMSEMDEDDNDSELTVTAVDEEATTSLDDNIDIDVDVDIAVAVNSEETINIDTNERASYECKTCKPPKMLSSIKAYFEHLRKDHKYKVSNDFYTYALMFLLSVLCSLFFLFILYS